MFSLTALIIVGVLVGVVVGYIIRRAVYNKRFVEKAVNDTKVIQDVKRRLDNLETTVQTTERRWKR